MSTAVMAAGESEPLSVRNFERLSEFIRSYSGIKMPSSKRVMLEGRLRRRVRATGAGNVNDYCQRLFDEGGIDKEITHLIDAVTTNKTDFFREPAHFNYLRDKILPTFPQDGDRREIKAWSAAASTGAEAYTLAMLLDEYCRECRGIRYSILATDICTNVLDRALAGCFDESMIDPVPVDLRRRHVLKAKNPDRREVRMAPHLRARIAFARLNLMDDHYPVESDFDLIFCRNVLIYFDRPTQAKVLERLCGHLRPGGHLFLGHSESISGANLPVTTAANTIFRRI